MNFKKIIFSLLSATLMVTALYIDIASAENIESAYYVTDTILKDTMPLDSQNTKQIPELSLESTIKLIRAMYYQTNSGNYDHSDHRWFRSNNGSTSVAQSDLLKLEIYNENEILKPFMDMYGYSSYAIDYYFDNKDASSNYINGKKPNFIFATLDGKEYCYYFANDHLIRTIDPDGTTQDYPDETPFIHALSKFGSFYALEDDYSTGHEDHILLSFVYNYYDSGNAIYICGTTIPNQNGKQSKNKVYIIDKNTLIADSFLPEEALQSNDNGYTFLSRYLSTPDSMPYHYAPSLDCLSCDSTNSHIDIIHGIYATH